MREVLTNSLPVFLSVAIGYFLVKRKIVPANASETLAGIVFKVVGPLMIFHVMYGLRIDSDKALLISSPLFVIVLMIALSYLLQRVFRLSQTQVGALIMCMILFSAGFIYSFTSLNFNETVFRYFAMLDILQFMLFLLVAPVIGSILGKRYGTTGEFDLKLTISKIVKDPFLIAMILGFFMTYSGIILPGFVMDTIGFFSATFFFLIALFTGMVLEIPSLKESIAVIVIYILRLGIIYIFLYGLYASGIFGSLEVSSAAMVYSAPFAMMCIVYAKEYGLDYRFATQLVLFSNLAQLIVYPVLISVLTGLP